MRSSYPTISVDLDLGRDSGQTAGAVKVNIFMTATDCVYFTFVPSCKQFQEPKAKTRKPKTDKNCIIINSFTTISARYLRLVTGHLFLVVC